MKSLAQVAAQLQGYDPQALRADAALQFLQGLVVFGLFIAWLLSSRPVLLA